MPRGISCRLYPLRWSGDTKIKYFNVNLFKIAKKEDFLQKSVANSDSPTGIVACWTFRHISNAKIEEFNDKIRWLIKQDYGFRDREYNKIENLSVAGNFKREINMSFCHKPSKRRFFIIRSVSGVLHIGMK